MELLRIRKNYQLTIPHSLRKKVNLAEGDYVEADVEDGKIIIRPVIVNRISKADREEAVSGLEDAWREIGEVGPDEIQTLVNEAIRETHNKNIETEK